jgi:hypothetical protein
MLRKVRLEMARGHEFPDGSSEHGYELHLPLTPDGKLDHAFWLKHRHDNLFRRFWAGQDDETGHLTHSRAGWLLAFDNGTHDAEIIVRADDHRFTVGEYVSMKERDGVTRTFRIASVA